MELFMIKTGFYDVYVLMGCWVWLPLCSCLFNRCYLGDILGAPYSHHGTNLWHSMRTELQGPSERSRKLRGDA